MFNILKSAYKLGTCKTTHSNKVWANCDKFSSVLIVCSKLYRTNGFRLGLYDKTSVHELHEKRLKKEIFLNHYKFKHFYIHNFMVIFQ